MRPKVYFIPARANESLDTIHKKLLVLYNEANFKDCIESKDSVAIKIHFGEEGNTTHIPAKFCVPLIDQIKKK